MDTNIDFTYFAFISYKHVDAQWAQWLQKGIQKYSLPAKTLKKHRGLHKRLSPVFLDRSNLRPGVLEEGLREEVSQSRFLIVLCSKAAHDEPKYINQEIRYFLESGGSKERIIPVIIEKTDHPERDCFPSALQEICQDSTILGANIYETTKERALLKIIAYMHGLKLTELVNDDEIRYKKKMAGIAISAALCICVVTIVGIWHWNYYLPHTKYYMNYVTKRGIPIGISKIDKADAKNCEAYYALTYQKKKVIRIQRLNGLGKIVEAPSNLYYETYVNAEFTYRDDKENTLLSVSMYDEDDCLQKKMVYSQSGKNVDLYAKDDDEDRTTYFASSRTTIGDDTYEEEGEDPYYSSIAHYRIEYDEDGYETEIRYVASIEKNTPTADAEGIYGLRYDRDPKSHQILHVYFLDYVGTSGNAKIQDDYKEMTIKGVSCIAYAYNFYGTIEEVAYYNKAGNLTLNENGIAYVDFSYDEKGNKIKDSYYGVDEKPANRAGGFASTDAVYDEKGNLIETNMYDTDGNLVLCSYGFATLTYEYDDEGNEIKLSCYGTDGNPIVCTEGYAYKTLEYDTDGNETKESYYGVDDEPILSEGYASAGFKYDKDGNVIEQSYYGTDGKPILCAEGYASVDFTYDEDGNVIEQNFYGTDGNPIAVADGVVRIELEYDDQGNEAKTSYFGIDGMPVLSSEGFASMQKEFDDQGNIIKESYFGTDEKPILSSNGYAIIKWEYDKQGNIVKETYCGTNGKPIQIEEGFASLELEYDEEGTVIKENHYGADGKLIED